jgi:cytochrome c nitrite reductase small subunit
MKPFFKSVRGALPAWPVIVALLAAVTALGLFAYTSDAFAYMGSAPSTCANCHVMDAQYENWAHAGHRPATECVDCHLPHDNPVSYYIEKGRTGMHDVTMFTTGQTPALIRAKPDTQAIIQANCIRCHADTVENVVMGAQPFNRRCWDCHRSVAHGQRGLSESPFQDSVLYPVK